MPDPQLYVPRFNLMDPDEVRPFVDTGADGGASEGAVP